MRKTLTIALTCMLLTGVTTVSNAAFYIKSPAVTTPAPVTAPASPHTLSQHKGPRVLRSMYRAAIYDEDFGRRHSSKRSAWPGVTSLALGIFGWIFAPTWIITGIGAIVLGIIGLNQRRYQFAGGAIAGIILGLLQVIFFIILVIAIATLFAL